MFRKILVPLDASNLAEQALATAATIAARAPGTPASIELMLVDTESGRIAERGGHGSVEQRIYVNGVAEEASRLLEIPVTGVVIAGDPASAIVAHAKYDGADLIVMTTHGRTGLRRALIGSVADRVVREAGVPVVIQRPVADRNWRIFVSSGFHRILVPLDGDEISQRVVAPALDLCGWMEAKPILARVVMPVVEMTFADSGVPAPGIVDDEATRHLERGAQDALTALALDIEADARIRVDTVVAVAADVGAALADIAKTRGADLIAMTTHGRGASRILFASVSDRLLRDTKLPLMMLHPGPAGLPVEPLRRVEPAMV